MDPAYGRRTRTQRYSMSHFKHIMMTVLLSITCKAAHAMSQWMARFYRFLRRAKTQNRIANQRPIANLGWIEMN